MAFDIYSFLTSFINEYFLYPLKYPNAYPPYNVFNTGAFVLVALVAAYLLYKLIVERLKLRVNADFFFSAIPFVVFGAFLRVTQDANLLPREIVAFGISLFPFVTPGIYVLVFLLLVGSFAACAIAYGRERREMGMDKAVKATGVLGWLFAAIALLALLSRGSFPNAVAGASIVFLALAATALFFYADKKIFQRRTRGIELAAVFGQCLDGAATFIGIGIAGYGEQHVVGNALMSSFGGPVAFFLVKVVFAYAVILVARHEFRDDVKDQQAMTFLLLLITIFGIGPGLRDLARITLGV